ncbi:DUF4376 domain-containing protein [Actinobacillus lignieresii]|uniref:DUF4376 domain-containing protein n=1 Tax=Actinobacillus lignieresii TaxID=720 RepID=A0A380TUN7_ACTLI|nr:DUF4376 domain-containing protein [Actinobacillus lignieresii]SUT91527.1 Uncharacterised protein [Actinobacillus lignieresii]
MIVYYLKSNPKNYVIFPTPANIGDYYQVDVDDGVDLSQKTLVIRDDNPVLVDISHDVDLAEKQEIMRKRINKKRDEMNAKGVFVKSLNRWFDSDADAQRRLNGFISVMREKNIDLSVTWTDADNNNVDNFGKTECADVMLAIFELESTNHAVAFRHKDAMLKLDNPYAYDYSDGWSGRTNKENKNEK